MLEPLDEIEVFDAEFTLLKAPAISNNLLEGDETDRLIDGIDLENDDDLIELLGALLDG